MHVWNWLLAWGVPDHLANAMFTAGVDGRTLISLYWDARRGRYSRPASTTASGSVTVCWTGILDALPAEPGPASGPKPEEVVAPVMRACGYAAELDFLLPTGDWVREMR